MAESPEAHENEDHPLIAPIEQPPMTITLVMADSNTDPPRLPPPPRNGFGALNPTFRAAAYAQSPMGYAAQPAAQPWPGNTADEYSRASPITGGQARVQTNESVQRTIVIIAVDISTHSNYAFDHYMNHVHRPDNRVILVHSVPTPRLDVQMPASGSGAPISYVTSSSDHLSCLLEETQNHISRVRQHFEQRIRALPHSVSYTFHFVAHSSTPGASIVDVIARVRPSFVVLGSSEGSFKRTSPGSVGHYVMNHSNVPVFICNKT